MGDKNCYELVANFLMDSAAGWGLVAKQPYVWVCHSSSRWLDLGT